MADLDPNEFPILCEDCLGDDPYVRMTKRPFGKSCKICERPFTNFRWQPRKDLRFKQTEICSTCARIKNCCQTCTLDLEFKVPIRIRDTALKIKDDIAHHDRNREYYLRGVDNELEKTGMVTSHSQTTKAKLASRELLKKYVRSEPYYKQHMVEALTNGKSAIEAPDPYKKLLAGRTDEKNLLVPPDDLSIMALFMTGVDETVSEMDLREFFGRFGEIKSVAVIHRSKCAFVNFTTRSAAEKAAEFAHYESTINGKKLKVQWARPKAGTPMGPRIQRDAEPLMGRFGDEIVDGKSPILVPPPGSSRVQYRAQNPTQLGSATHRGDRTEQS